MPPRKIRIIGSVGSGKSTLARELSARLDVPYCETDHLVWRRSREGPDIRNAAETRDAQLNAAIGADGWIVEGMHDKWTRRSFEEVDLIVYLDTPVWRRNVRILKRFAMQKLGFEQGNYEQTLAMLANMYRWSYGHARRDKAVILELLAPYRPKLLILRDNSDLASIVGRS